MLQKKLNLYRDAQKKNEWSDFGTVTSITDAIVLVVGLGDIGLHFARLASTLGACVIGLKRSMGPCPEGVHELHTMDELDEWLRRWMWSPHLCRQQLQRIICTQRND